MNEHDRRRIKSAVVSVLDHYSKPLKLPVPIKSVVKSFNNIRLVPFSQMMSDLNKTYEEIRSYAGTDDAVTDYNSADDRYLILYNDIDPIRLKSNRHRWNIAHELGHVALGHHKEYSQTKLFRNSLDNEIYKKLEDEANLFAAYMLAPHIVLNIVCDFDTTTIGQVCGISGKASEFRTECYKLWRRRRRFEPYDAKILSLYADFAEANQIPRRSVRQWLDKHRICTVCKCNIHNRRQGFCVTCGSQYSRKYETRNSLMVYEGIPLSNTGVAIRCPACDNEQTAFGTFCIICGKSLVNMCSGEPYQRTSDCEYPLPGNARYCPHCGSETTFFRNRFIKSWNGQGEPLSLEELLPF